MNNEKTSAARSPDREQVGEAAEAARIVKMWDDGFTQLAGSRAIDFLRDNASPSRECGEQQDCGCEYGKPRCPKNCRLVAILAASGTTLGEIDWREKFFAEQRARMELEAALHLVVEDKPQPQAAEPKGLAADEYTRKFEALCGAWCVNEAERKTAKLFWLEARALLSQGE